MIDGVKLQTVSNDLPTIDLKGKKYVEVKERVRGFRALCPNGQIITEVMNMTDDAVTFRASVIVDGVVLATGTASEEKGTSYINKTSYIENCETSAVGRALGFLGIGIPDSIGSADEVRNAQEQQGKIKEAEIANKKIDFIKAEALAVKCKESDIDETKLFELCKVGSYIELTEALHSNIINHWDKVVETCKRPAK